MGVPSKHKLDAALGAALDDLGAAAPEALFAFLRPDRIAERSAELAGDDPSRSVSATWVRKLASDHGGFDKAGFGYQMLERAIGQLRQGLRANAAAYAQAIEAVAGGAGREAIGPAIIGHIRDSLAEGSAAERARARIYYLAVAAADADAGRDFREALADWYATAQREYAQLLAGSLEAMGREPLEGVAPRQLGHAIAALIEGYSLQRRSGVELDDAEIVDAVMRLMAAHTRAADRPGLDPDRELIGRPRPRTSGEPVSGSTLSERSIHAAVIAAVEDAEPEAGEVIRHAMLHGPAGSPTSPRTERSRRMAIAVYDHVRAGGELRLIVAIDTPGQLERTLATQRELLGPDPEGTLTVRALIGAAPVISPLVVGERFAAIGREGDGERALIGALQFFDPASIEILSGSFDDTWRSPKAITLIHDSEPYPRGIRAAEIEIDLGAQPD